MDSISDSDSEDAGSIPAGVTWKLMGKATCQDRNFLPDVAGYFTALR